MVRVFAKCVQGRLKGVFTVLCRRRIGRVREVVKDVKGRKQMRNRGSEARRVKD